jgi:hypothetical protein
MEKCIKFLGVCIIISCLFISLSICFSIVMNRYKPMNTDGLSLIDSFTGTVYHYHDGSMEEIPIK